MEKFRVRTQIGKKAWRDKGYWYLIHKFNNLLSIEIKIHNEEDNIHIELDEENALYLRDQINKFYGKENQTPTKLA